LFICCGWFVSEWRALQREQKAAAVLKRDYHADARVGLSSVFKLDWKERVDLHLQEALQRGRLYGHVDSVRFQNATVDRRAWEQLARFRRIENLTFENCRMESGAECRWANPRSLTSLWFWGTPITVEGLRAISRFGHLQSLLLDGTALKGDWLGQISRLRELSTLQVYGGDMSDGAADSLAGMSALTSLVLYHVKIGPTLGTALARLGKLEDLWIAETPFDDEGLRHVAALKQIRMLYLGGTAVTDKGMESLEELPKLRRLILSNTRVGDAGLRHLSKLSELMILVIGNTRATNSCLRTLTAMPSLQSAFVQGTRISETSPGFSGVLRDWGSWFPNEARAKEADDEARTQKKVSGTVIDSVRKNGDRDHKARGDKANY
jgi:hypothetical protein